MPDPTPLPWPNLPDAARPQTLEELARKAQENFDVLGRLLGGQRRIIAGAIGSTGTITAGVGFTVTHPGTGDYTVTFANPFPSVPVVILTPGPSLSNPQAHLHGSTPPTVTAFRVTITNAAGTASIDDNWTFLATI